MKKFLLLAFAMATCFATASAATDYGIEVNGYKITSDLYNFSTGGGMVTYYSSTCKLLISGVTFNRSGEVIKVKASSNRSSVLKIEFNGTNLLTSTGSDAIVLEEGAEFYVNRVTTVTTNGGGKYAVHVKNDEDASFYGSGSLLLEATDGYALGGESGGDEWAYFKINGCTLAGKRGNLVNLGRVQINAVSTNTAKSTTITLNPTKSSSYAHAKNVGTWLLQDGTHIESPVGYTTSYLSSSSYYNKTFVISDERDDPSLTKVGNFLYDTYTENGTTYARLRGLSLAYKQTSPTTVTIPGYVTLNGTTRRVMVGSNALYNLPSVTKVVLEYGVSSIQSKAFNALSSLNQVKIPSSVKTIGSQFLYYSGGSSSTFYVFWANLSPSSVSISSDAFAYCQASSRTVYMPTPPAVTAAKSLSAVTNYFTVSSYASSSTAYDFFSGNNYYVGTNMGSSSVQPEAALTGCSTANVSVSSSYIAYDGYLGLYVYCTSVAPQAFKNSTGVQSLNITYSSCNIGEEAFYGCTNLTSVQVNSKYIYERAFYGCTSLATLTLNEGVLDVRSQAFYSGAFSTLNIPASLTNFAVTAVDNCLRQSSFTVASRNSYYSTYSSYGSLYNKAQTKLVKVPSQNSYVGPNYYPSTLTTIGDYAFSYQRYNDHIDLPYGITTIGAMTYQGGHVFENAYIRSVKIPSSVTSINYSYMFNNCPYLEKILVATYANRKDVNSYTFSGTNSELRIYVPSSWDTPNENSSAPFYTDSYWKDHNVTYGAWDVLIGNMPYLLNTATDSYGYRTAYLVRGTHLLADGYYNPGMVANPPEFISHNGINYHTLLAPHAFEDSNIRSITINQPFVGTVGCQFSGCSNLQNLEFAATDYARHTTIPTRCFYGTNIENVNVPYGCTSVGDLAFANNPSLKKIFIPSSCVRSGSAEVASNFVRNCSSLAEMRINLTNPSNMNSPYSWKEVKDVAPDNAANGCFYGVPKSCKVYVPYGYYSNYDDYTSSNGHQIWQYFETRALAGAYDYSIDGTKDFVTFTGVYEPANNGSNEVYTAKFVYAPENIGTTAEMGSEVEGTYNYIVTDLDKGAFVASNLEDISIHWYKVTMTEIPDYAFAYTHLDSFPWFNKITKIGVSAFAATDFRGKLDLSECGGTGFYLDESAFADAAYVTSFVLPATTTYVGPGAMWAQEMEWGKIAREYEGYSDYEEKVLSYLNLESVTCHATTPPATGTGNPWFAKHQPFQTLYVPAGSIDAYRAANYWRNFGLIMPIQGGLQGDVNGDGVVSGADVTALYNVLLDGATPAGDADVNGDGVVSGADVTALYNLLLNE